MADVIIIYDTKTGATERAAATILEGVKAAGAAGLMKSVQDATEQDVTDARGIVLGSPNMYDNYTGPMREFLEGTLRRARPAGKIGAAFGTHKWNTGNVDGIQAAMAKEGIQIVAPPVDAMHRHVAEDDAALKALGETVGREVMKLKQAT